MLQPLAHPGPYRAAPCPMGFALAMIAGKWKPAVLTLLGERKLRFGELERRLPHVSRKVLVEQLRGLERDGLVESRVHPEVPPRVEYALTELGFRVLPLLWALGDFGRSVLAERRAAPGVELEPGPALAGAV